MFTSSWGNYNQKFKPKLIYKSGLKKGTKITLNVLNSPFLFKLYLFVVFFNQ